MSKPDIYSERELQEEDDNNEQLNQLIMIIQTMTDKISELQTRIEALEKKENKPAEIYEKDE